MEFTFSKDYNRDTWTRTIYTGPYVNNGKVYYNNNIWIYNTTTANRIIETNSSGFWKVDSGSYGSYVGSDWGTRYCFSGSAYFYTAVAKATSEKKGDTKYSDVTSTDPNAYPINGAQGNYWYVKSNPQ